MAKKPSDPISPWFVAAEETGEFIGIRFGRIPTGSTVPQWTFLSHIEVDGIGGFAELLRRQGVSYPQLPQIKHPSSPSKLSLIKLLPKLLKPQRRIEWSHVDKGPQPPENNAAPTAVAWHGFDELTTTQIRRVCRKTGVTVNSLLLKNLSKAIRPFLKDQAAAVPWMVPVNLRGKVTRDRDVENHSSYVGINIKSFETSMDVHRSIYAALNRGEHWSNWQGYSLGKVLTHNMRKSMITSGKCMSQWNLGSFSNLGDWDPDKTITQRDCMGTWVFTPPVLRCQWIGAGCVTFQNRLSIAIQAHPDLTSDPAVPNAWIQNWIKEIDLDISSVLTVTPQVAPSIVVPIVAA